MQQAILQARRHHDVAWRSRFKKKCGRPYYRANHYDDGHAYAATARQQG